MLFILVSFCWPMFVFLNIPRHFCASCVAQLSAKRPDVFLQLGDLVGALKSLDGLLDSPVEALLFPPLSPPVQLQLGLLHQRLTRHDTQSGGRCVISCRPRQHQLLALGDTWDVVPFAIQPSWRRRTIHFKRDGRRDGAALGGKH